MRQVNWFTNQVYETLAQIQRLYIGEWGRDENAALHDRIVNEVFHFSRNLTNLYKGCQNGH